MNLFFASLFSAPLLYLDPGSGSFLIQLLMAAALGIGVAVKMYWTKIKSLFTGKKADKPDSDVDEE
jgi:hypothetical protein